jgi:hypothetical protein
MLLSQNLITFKKRENGTFCVFITVKIFDLEHIVTINILYQHSTFNKEQIRYYALMLYLKQNEEDTLPVSDIADDISF